MLEHPRHGRSVLLAHAVGEPDLAVVLKGLCVHEHPRHGRSVLLAHAVGEPDLAVVLKGLCVLEQVQGQRRGGGSAGVRARGHQCGGQGAVDARGCRGAGVVVRGQGRGGSSAGVRARG